MSEKDKLITWLRSLQDRKILDMALSVYLPKGESSASAPFEVQLQVDGLDSGKIVLAGDGESLRWSPESLKSINIQGLGAIESKSNAKGFHKEEIVGSLVKSADLIVEGDVPIGMCVHLSGDRSLLIMNCGDEMVIRMNGDHPLLHAGGVDIQTIF